MKAILLLLTLIFRCSFFYAQKHDNVWIFGYGDDVKKGKGVSMNFVEKPPAINSFFSPAGFKYLNAAQVLSDSSGGLICYTNGCDLVNRKHEYMLNGDSLNIGEPWAGGHIFCDQVGYPTMQSLLFLLYPAHKNQYVLVHLNQRKKARYPDELLYTVIDAAGDHGDGAVTEKARFVHGAAYADALTAVKHGNGRDWWIIAPVRESNMYHIFLLSPQGISQPKVQSIGDAGLYNFACQAVFSPDGTQYARHAPYYGKAQILSFDRCAGEFCCPRNISYPVKDSTNVIAGGLAFSPNSRLLYISITIEMFQFDTWSNGSGLLKIGDYDGFKSPHFSTLFFQQVLAPDGKIYMGTINGNDVLHIVHAPDSLGLACRFEQHTLKLPTQYGSAMPNFPHYRLYDLRGSICDSLGIDTPGGGDTTWAIRKDRIQVWPSPADQVVTVSIPPEAVGPLQVYNVLGQLMYELSSVRGSLSLTLDVASYPAGVYFATVYVDKEFRYTARWVVARGR